MKKIYEGGNKSGLYAHMKILIEKGKETNDSKLKLMLFAFQSMFISIWVSRLEIAEFPDSIRRSAP